MCVDSVRSTLRTFDISVALFPYSVPHPLSNTPNCGMSIANYFVTMYETPSHTACTHTVLYVAWLYQCLFWIMSTPLRTPTTSPLHTANSSPCSDMLTRTDQHGLQSSRLTLHPPILSDIVLIACLPHLQSPCLLPPPPSAKLLSNTSYRGAFRHNGTSNMNATTATTILIL